MNKIYEQTRLSKLLEGIRSEYKSQLILRNPKSLKEAIEYIELIDTNTQLTSTNDINAIGTVQPDSMLNKHIQTTHELIANLTQKVNDMAITKNNQQRNSSTSRSMSKERELSQNRANTQRHDRPGCDYCHKTNHLTQNCFYKQNNFQTQRNSRQTFRETRIPNSQLYRREPQWRQNYERQGRQERYNGGYDRSQSRGRGMERHVRFEDQVRNQARGEQRNGVYRSFDRSHSPRFERNTRYDRNQSPMYGRNFRFNQKN